MPHNPLTERLLGERRALMESIRAQADQVERLRDLVEGLEQRLALDVHLLEELDGVLGLSAQMRLESLDERLRGQRLEEVAIAVLREDVPPGTAVHYRDWFDMLRARGHRVAGKNPLGTFLAQINRSPSIERIGSRTGKYRLASG